jgi:hypothetical protein
MGLLAALPVIAYAPAVVGGRLLAPGDGTYLHFPLRAAVWDAYRRGELPSWNPAVFSGTGLLAAYRPGALYPLAFLLTPLPPFVAFQLLILVSLSATAVLGYLYARRLGAEEVGAYFTGLAFALGPYLVNHLGDSATVIAAPCLLTCLIAAEAFVARMTAWRASGLALAIALLCTAGSPEALRAGFGILGGRLLLAHVIRRGAGSLAYTLLPLFAGGLLAAPQLLPSVLALAEAGRQVVGFADIASPGPTGGAGLILGYVSHTPALALALASMPLALRAGPVRILGMVMALCLALQWGRGPLTAPGALALVFDLALALLAGLSLSAQWRQRLAPEGVRLRGYFAVAALASAAVLPVSAAIAGPLAPKQAAGVGLLALGLIIYLSLAGASRPMAALVWLIPLTLSFLLQPHGRGVLENTPTRAEVSGGSATRVALDRLMGPGRGERMLTLTRRWPPEALELAFGNLAYSGGLRSANGYDPMVSLRNRAMLESLNAGGVFGSGAFFRSDCSRLDVLGVRWIQVPVSALAAVPDASGPGETIDTTIRSLATRYFAFPVVPATEIRVVSSLSDAVGVSQGESVARLIVHLASGRRFTLALRAGEETAEWAYDRGDVRPVIRHGRPQVSESWPAPGGDFLGHRYLGRLRLPGRYLVSAVTIEMTSPRCELLVSRLALFDQPTQTLTGASLVAAFVSDAACFSETARTPAVRLFELKRPSGRARVVEELRVLSDDEAVRRALARPAAEQFDLGRVALATRKDAVAASWPRSGPVSRPSDVSAEGGRLAVSAEGPGLLVLAESWDPGWSASVDGQPTRVLRVNYAQMGVVLHEGVHRVTLRHQPRGLASGLVLAAAALAALGFSIWRESRAKARAAGPRES